MSATSLEKGDNPQGTKTLAKHTETHKANAVMEKQRDVLKQELPASRSPEEEKENVEVSDEESNSVAPRVKKTRHERNLCLQNPLATMFLIVIVMVIVLLYYRKPAYYFQPLGSEDIGGVWCEVSHEKIECPKCTGHTKVYQIEETIENPALLVDALYRWKYFEYDFWNFHMKLQGFANRSRLYFGLLTFDRGYVNVIALKFLLETDSGGIVFGSHFELPVNSSVNNDSGRLEYVKTSASEMRLLFADDWTYLHAVGSSFAFRIERGPRSSFLRYKSCSDEECGEKAFEGSFRLENHFQPLEKKQIFFLSCDKTLEKGEIEFEKRCYVVDERQVQFCPDSTKNSLKRCKRLTQGLIKGPWASVRVD